MEIILIAIAILIIWFIWGFISVPLKWDELNN